MWITNNPETAKLLRSIDAQEKADREAARNLPLAQKVEAFRLAKKRRQDAHDVIMMAEPPSNRPHRE